MHEDKYLLSSAYHTIRILDILKENRKLTVSEISRKMDINKTSVFRYLYTLEAGGYIYKTRDAKYMLGRKFVQMGDEVRSRQTEYSLAKPVMDDLRDRFGETIYLTRLMPGLTQAFEERSRGSHNLWAKTRGSVRVPIQRSASGKVLLAGLLGTVHEKELADFPTMAEEFKTIRKEGYAIEDGDIIEGVAAIAVPIVTYKGEVAASLSMIGTAAGIMANRQEYLEALRKSAADIGELLGL